MAFNMFPEHEISEVGRACAQYQHRQADFLIKREGDDVVIWYTRSAKGRRYKAFDGAGWTTRFEDDLSAQYFRMGEANHPGEIACIRS
jgi:hypothetical protein